MPARAATSAGRRPVSSARRIGVDAGAGAASGRGPWFLDIRRERGVDAVKAFHVAGGEMGSARMVRRHSRVPITEFAVKIRQETPPRSGRSQAGRTSGRRKQRRGRASAGLIWKQPMSRFRTPWARNPSAWASALRRSENQRPSPAWFTVHGHGPNAFFVRAAGFGAGECAQNPDGHAGFRGGKDGGVVAERRGGPGVGLRGWRAGKDDTDKDHGREAAPGVSARVGERAASHHGAGSGRGVVRTARTVRRRTPLSATCAASVSRSMP